MDGGVDREGIEPPPLPPPPGAAGALERACSKRGPPGEALSEVARALARDQARNMAVLVAALVAALSSTMFGGAGLLLAVAALVVSIAAGSMVMRAMLWTAHLGRLRAAVEEDPGVFEAYCAMLRGRGG